MRRLSVVRTATLFEETPEFISVLDRWLAWGEKSDARKLAGMRKQISPLYRDYKGFLYRGMIVGEDFFSKKRWKFEEPSSWTPDMSLALKFVTDEKFKMRDRAGVGVLLKKKIAPKMQIFDIGKWSQMWGRKQLVDWGLDDMSADSALKESEVLIDGGLVISSKDVTRV